MIRYFINLFLFSVTAAFGIGIDSTFEEIYSHYSSAGMKLKVHQLRSTKYKNCDGMLHRWMKPESGYVVTALFDDTGCVEIGYYLHNQRFTKEHKSNILANNYFDISLAKKKSSFLSSKIEYELLSYSQYYGLAVTDNSMVFYRKSSMISPKYFK